VYAGSLHTHEERVDVDVVRDIPLDQVLCSPIENPIAE
jgi:hypothetical protein